MVSKDGCRIDQPVLQFETASGGQDAPRCEMARSGGKGAAAQLPPRGKAVALPGQPVVQRLVYHGLRFFMGAVFLYSSYDKILHPQAFARALYNFQILPDAVVNLAALILSWLELLIGLCLVIGVWLPGAVVTVTGLLVVFIGALAFNLARGLDVNCGCFSSAPTEGPATIWTVGRDMGLLAVSIFLTMHVFRRDRSAGRPADTNRN